MLKLYSLFIGSILIATMTAHAKEAETIRISGSQTAFEVLKTTAQVVQKNSTFEIRFEKSSTGEGLRDLSQKKIDLTLVSEPLLAAAQAAHALGTDIDAKDYSINVVTIKELAFIVHPANPVSKLDRQQIQKILSGQIKNWQEVGGKNLRIQVYLEREGRGTRALIQNDFLRNGPFTADALSSTDMASTAASISHDESSFGAINLDLVGHSLKKVETEKIRRPIGFLLRSDSTPQQKAVAEEFAKRYTP